MSWRDTLSPARMERVALVAPEQHRHHVLAEVARSAAVELDLPYSPGTGPEEFDKAAAAAVVSGPIAAWVGWAPAKQLSGLTEMLAPLGAAVVPLVRPRGVEPPTLITGADPARVPRILVDTYGTVPYADIDPSRLAVAAYVVMFGIMFGDVGHGALLVAAGFILRSGRIARLKTLQKTWSFVTVAGLTSMFFGLLYGEAFGPTGLVPVLWIAPLANPIELMIAAMVFGAVLLAGAYVIGTVNRFREGGWGYALYAQSGVAGSLLFVALGLLAWGLFSDLSPLVVTAVILAVAALVLLFVGYFIDAGGGGTGVFEAGVEVVDAVVRLGSNVVSFARLAAFGLTHAALLMIVWEATSALWAPDWRAAVAILIFVIGNIVTFALEALVAGIQALRLEYYELFSRIFQTEGRPFHPWTATAPSQTSQERHEP
jgi:V/A-type H+-transporting ATPase subunit I